jgi:hypothetical protein
MTDPFMIDRREQYSIRVAQRTDHIRRKAMCKIICQQLSDYRPQPLPPGSAITENSPRPASNDARRGHRSIQPYAKEPFRNVSANFGETPANRIHEGESGTLPQVRHNSPIVIPRHREAVARDRDLGTRQGITTTRPVHPSPMQRRPSPSQRRRGFGSSPMRDG